MIKLVFATNNKHKLDEIKNLIGNDFKILSLKEINCLEDIPETKNTLEGNASLKAFYIYNKYKINCFADDTGLEIDALNGRPGVYSARYAGDEHDFEKNMNKVLKELQGITNRKARFRTVVSLIINGKETLFEGIVNGNMLYEKKGEKGFGYDPIFQPKGYKRSFAEMSLDEKNKISHRGKAIRKLVEYLKKLK
ncbi:MAG: non-canonical purine NTP diphosphatase [Bacteroidales bacterium]|nr:non-canonical purine NTP diphosphatase [Bacteroidales bacterium]